MEQVFAPWRIEWVERSDGSEFEGCVFCELPTRESDREYNVVARGEHAYVLLNNYPYNPGHVMVIPYQHTGEYRDLDDDVLLDQERLKQRTIDAIESAFDPDGLNVGMNIGGTAAGGSIGGHLHTHVVPRWSGDTDFMAVVSDTSVIVEGIEDSYDRLHEAFAAQDDAVVEDENTAVVVE